MDIDHCFQTGSVVAELSSGEKFTAIREIIYSAPVFRQIPDLNSFEEAVISREKMQSTGFGHGVAVAHGRIPGLSRVLIGFGISRAGIPFEAADGKPVHLLFVIASPPHLSLDYLQIGHLHRPRRPGLRVHLRLAEAAQAAGRYMDETLHIAAL